MFKGKNVFVVIPARGGSKGVKNKNIRSVLGKPLIAYTIDCAIDSGVVDRIFVSTDSEEIADISKKFRAEIIKRPEVFSSDMATGIEVIKHSIEEMKKIGSNDGYLLYLQPTSPLREPKDIIETLNLAYNKKANFIVGVCETEHSPLFANKLSDDLSLNGFIPKELSSKNRQELKPYYRVNGAMYLVRLPLENEELNLYSEDSYAYIMPQSRSIDIDSELDLTIAEVLINGKRSKE